MTGKSPLNKTGQVRREMARVYRAAKDNEMTTQNMARMIYGLKNIAEVIFMTEYERRLDLLEARERDAREYVPRSSKDLLLTAQPVNGHDPEEQTPCD